MTRRANNRTMGNAALITAASNPEVVKAAERAVPVIIEQQRKAIRTGLWIIGGAAGIALVYFGGKWVKKQQRISLYKQAASNPNFKAAIDIFSAIPERMKKDTGSVFAPGQLLIDWVNNLMFWQQSDSDRIMLIAERITDLKEVARAFRIFYDQDLIPLLEQAMSPVDFDRFITNANRDKNYLPVGYSAADAGKIAVTNKKTLLATFYNGKITGIATIDANRRIYGYTTGKTFQDKYGTFSAPGTIWVELFIESVRKKYGANAAVKKSDIALIPASQYPNHTP